MMRLHVFNIAIAGRESARCPSQTSTAPQEATGRLTDDVRRILACRGSSLGFVVLITTLELEPLVSETAQADMGLSSSPAGRPNTTPAGNHTIIVVPSIKARSRAPLHTSALCGGVSDGGHAASAYRDAVSLPVALQRSASGATLASWQQSHGSSGSVEALRLVICAYRRPVGSSAHQSLAVPCAIRLHPHPGA